MTTSIALFNNKGGVGKTTLTYHLAHMVARMGWRVLALDLDPQANLTSAFFDEDRLEGFWEQDSTDTILSAVAPLIRQLGDVQVPTAHPTADRLWVVPGDLGLSSFEDRLSDAWPRSVLGEEGAIRVTTATQALRPARCGRFLPSTAHVSRSRSKRAVHPNQTSRLGPGSHRPGLPPRRDRRLGTAGRGR